MADSQDRASFRQSLADALATGDLRRLQLTWTFASIGSWTFFIVLAVFALDPGGGNRGRNRRPGTDGPRRAGRTPGRDDRRPQLAPRGAARQHHRTVAPAR